MELWKKYVAPKSQSEIDMKLKAVAKKWLWLQVNGKNFNNDNSG